jgi:catalase
MKRSAGIIRRLLVLTLLGSGIPCTAQVTAVDVVSALERAYGVHAGERRNHAKGTCGSGTFTGTAEGAQYSRSALFGGRSMEVVARFSVAGGNPAAGDAERSPRGMALEFRLPEGKLQHMTMIDTPMFFAAMPRTFLDKMLALQPDPATGRPDPKAWHEFLTTHPDNQAQTAFLAAHNPPATYTHSAYYGIHTFKFIDRDNRTTLVRWRFVPRDGEKQLSSKQLTSMPHDFLEPMLIQRTRRGPVKWDMLLTIGAPGDVQNDPTVLWPADRKEIKVGTLTIVSAMNQKGAPCENINYDPLVMSDGIAATNDPILLFRSAAYALSFSRRLQGK